MFTQMRVQAMSALLGAATLLAGCQPYRPISAASVDQALLAKTHDAVGQCAPAVVAALTEVGLSAASFDRVVLEAHYARIGDNDFVTGYTAWGDLAGCKGYVVVQVDAGCRSTQIYSRGACPVPGLTHY